jgi:hypothetical protein
LADRELARRWVAPFGPVLAFRRIALDSLALSVLKPPAWPTPRMGQGHVALAAAFKANR